LECRFGCHVFYCRALADWPESSRSGGFQPLMRGGAMGVSGGPSNT
jgi:hypothetical protein